MTDTTQDYIETLFSKLFSKRREKALSKQLSLNLLQARDGPLLGELARIHEMKKMHPEGEAFADFAEKAINLEESLKTLLLKGVESVHTVDDGWTVVEGNCILKQRLLFQNQLRKGMPPEIELKAALAAGTISEEEYWNVKAFYDPNIGGPFTLQETPELPKAFSPEALEIYRRTRARRPN